MSDSPSLPIPVPVRAQLQPGSVIGAYRLDRFIGMGGMATIFAATHMYLDRVVAIKVMNAHAAVTPTTRERFVREAQTLARIRHPNVVAVQDLGFEGESPYLVMDYLEGESLEAAIQRRPVMDPTQAMTVLIPIASALVAVHEAGLVHRDVKPDNILLALDDEGRAVPKLIDFGLAKAVDGALIGARHTIAGTPQYMAPEQLRGSRTLDARTDQYAFGVMLYRLLTGLMPFEAPSILALAFAIEAGAAVRPTVIQPSIPEELEAIVLRAMHADAEMRFPDMRALACALTPFATARTTAALESQLGVPCGLVQAPVLTPTPEPMPEAERLSTRPKRMASGMAPRLPPRI